MKRKLVIVIITIAVLIVFVTSLSIGDAMFNQQIEIEIERLFAVSGNIPNTVFTRPGF